MNGEKPWGQRVKELRTALRASQTELAEEAGIDLSTVWKWENYLNRRPQKLYRQAIERVARENKIEF